MPKCQATKQRPVIPRLSRSSRWLSISSLRNAILGNHIIDFLKRKALNRTRNGSRPDTLLMAQGNTFEERVLSSIKNTFGTGFVDLSEYKFSDLRYSETLRHLRTGTPVIAQGALKNYTDMTMGFPDLILKGSAFKEVFPKDFLEQFTELTHDKYYVIDIKWATLHLKADNKSLLKTPQTTYYQAQVTLYTSALNECLPKNNVKHAFILGRGYTTVNGPKENCFDMLAVVDLEGDSHFKQTYKEALEWTRGIHSVQTPPSVNMKALTHVGYDVRAERLKAEARDQGNITCLWGCNDVNRNIASRHGIVSFRDPRCTPSVLGVLSGYKEKVLSRILKVNRIPETKSPVTPKRLPAGSIVDTVPGTTEIFLDFEAVSCLFDNFSTFPIKETGHRIFLIGYLLRGEGGDKYHRELAEDLTDQSEERMLIRFLEFCKGLPNVRIFHWGSYEAVNFKKLYMKYPLAAETFPLESLNMVDVCAYIKSVPMGIRGCYNFSIKSVYPSLVSLSLIQPRDLSYESPVQVVQDGLEAMTHAYKAYNGINDKKIHDVLTYNKSDCDHLMEIVMFLRGRIQRVVTN